jgi:hypothetical protein
MLIGIITGSGTYALPEFEAAELIEHRTPYGEAAITRGTFADSSVLHISRHGAGHVRLSNQVNHRANIWALKDLGARAVIGCTACGAVDPTVVLGSLVVFDDLQPPAGRVAVHVLHRPRRLCARTLDPSRGPVLPGAACGAGDGGGGGRARGA